jgi:hypothetical protein
MLRIEFEPAHESDPCACCGKATIALTRFVYKDDVAHAIYYARFSKGHPELPVIATVSIGEWSEGSAPEQRVAFALELRSTESQCQVMGTDAQHSPWRESKILGRTLDRAEALAHPLLPEVFHITDHMVSDDAPLKGHLNAS